MPPKNNRKTAKVGGGFSLFSFGKNTSQQPPTPPKEEQQPDYVQSEFYKHLMKKCNDLRNITDKFIRISYPYRDSNGNKVTGNKYALKSDDGPGEKTTSCDTAFESAVNKIPNVFGGLDQRNLDEISVGKYKKHDVGKIGVVGDYLFIDCFIYQDTQLYKLIEVAKFAAQGLIELTKNTETGRIAFPLFNSVNELLTTGTIKNVEETQNMLEQYNEFRKKFTFRYHDQPKEFYKYIFEQLPIDKISAAFSSETKDSSSTVITYDYLKDIIMAQLNAQSKQTGGNKKSIYTKTNQIHTDGKGRKRVVYQKGSAKYIKKKDAKTGKFRYKKIRD